MNDLIKAICSCGMPIATHSPNNKVSHSWRPESSNKHLQKQLKLQSMDSRNRA